MCDSLVCENLSDVFHGGMKNMAKIYLKNIFQSFFSRKYVFLGLNDQLVYILKYLLILGLYYQSHTCLLCFFVLYTNIELLLTKW